MFGGECVLYVFLEASLTATSPYLAAQGADVTIRGIQSQGVIACAKHFVGNEQEHYRGGGGSIATSSVGLFVGCQSNQCAAPTSTIAPCTKSTLPPLRLQSTLASYVQPPYRALS
jgi:hypothetical protein